MDLENSWEKILRTRRRVVAVEEKQQETELCEKKEKKKGVGWLEVRSASAWFNTVLIMAGCRTRLEHRENL